MQGIADSGHEIYDQSLVPSSTGTSSSNGIAAFPQRLFLLWIEGGLVLQHPLTVLALLALLTACATVPNTSIENMEGELPAGSGLVVAETIVNGERIVGRVRHWTEIILWREDYDGEDDTFRIESLSYSLSTRAYMGVVPAGTYRVGMLYTHMRVLDTFYWARALATPVLGRFEVKAGQVTNLGTLLYQPFQDRNWFEEDYPDYAITRVPNDSLWETAKLANPALSAQISIDAPILGWIPDRYDALRDASARAIRKAGLPTRIRTLSDGRVILTGLLGSILEVRDGELLDFSIDSHRRVLDFAELPDGQFLVGSEFGELARISSLGESVHYVPVDRKPAHVIGVELGGNGQAYVAVYATDGYSIYRYNPSDDSLTRLRDFPPKEGQGSVNYNEDVRHPHPILLGTPEGVAVYFEEFVHRYDGSADRWSTSDSLMFFAIDKQADGYLTGIPYSHSSGTLAPRYSSDQGLTWVRTREKGGMLESWLTPTFRFSNGEFIRTGDDVDVRIFRESKVLEKVPVLLSTDYGLNWDTVGHVPRGCLYMAPEASTDDRLYILCNNGGTLTSEDRGRTWQPSSPRRIPDFESFPEGLKVRYDREELGANSPLPPVVPTN